MQDFVHQPYDGRLMGACAVIRQTLNPKPKALTPRALNTKS